MPCYSEYFSKLLLHLCQKNNRENILTSDGISGAMLRAINQKLYCLRFITPSELEFDLMTSRSVSNVVQTPSGRCRVHYKHPDVERAEHIEADVIIWATDYVAAEKNFLNDSERTDSL
ncbi:Lysine/ornithine N-monooxygenase [Salmonella enterica subsp. arizonae]|nr:Lysine/ornithine N-monooxygenase [Salmonella enterica subsp. arizonae]